MNYSKKHDQVAVSTVYHFHPYYFGLVPYGARPQWPFDYEPVAQVLEADLEQVFYLTQNIELSKEEEARVDWIDPLRPNRSTMIGDVVEVNVGNGPIVWRLECDRWEQISAGTDE